MALRHAETGQVLAFRACKKALMERRLVWVEKDVCPEHAATDCVESYHAVGGWPPPR